MAFNQCPNGCGAKGGIFLGKDVFECKTLGCKKKFCYKCNSGRCPDCGETSKRKIGIIK